MDSKYGRSCRHQKKYKGCSEINESCRKTCGQCDTIPPVPQTPLPPPPAPLLPPQQARSGSGTSSGTSSGSGSGGGSGGECFDEWELMYPDEVDSGEEGKHSCRILMNEEQCLTFGEKCRKTCGLCETTSTLASPASPASPSAATPVDGPAAEKKLAETIDTEEDTLGLQVRSLH